MNTSLLLISPLTPSWWKEKIMGTSGSVIFRFFSKSRRNVEFAKIPEKWRACLAREWMCQESESSKSPGVLQTEKDSRS